MNWIGHTGTAVSVPAHRRAAHVAFMAVLGVAGWTALAAASYLPGFEDSAVWYASPAAYGVFFVVIVGARSMAVRLLPEIVVSVDTGFYIAAAVCLGSVGAGRLVALALTLDSLIRLLGAEASARRRAGGRLLEDGVHVLYFGGMSGALLMTMSRWFEVDRFTPGAWADVEWTALRLVFSVGLCFLVVHYAVQGMRLALAGHSPHDYARKMVVPSILAEVALLPLAVVVVLIYRPEKPVGFILLGTTYLLINFVFNQLANRRAELRQRVSELETLNATSRELAASLQLHELVETVARETVRAIPEAALLTLARRERGDDLVVEFYDRERRRFETLRLREDEGATGAVMRSGRALRIPDLSKSEFDGGNLDAGVQSWMGVPLVIFGKSEGVLAVQSRERNAFSADQQRLLESIGAQTAVALQNARLYELAMIDGLTGLYVRRYFDARMDEELQRSHRFGTEFSVVMMDLDDFKQLNDSHGHLAGDQVLKTVSRIVKGQMRGVDTAARYGGEELAMILPRTGMLDAYNQAERIRQLIEEHSVQHDGALVRATASFGISSYPDSGASTAEDVIRRADIALYRSKKTGKNRVELYWGDSSAEE